MYIITVKGEENNGAYSVGNAEGEQIYQITITVVNFLILKDSF